MFDTAVSMPRSRYLLTHPRDQKTVLDVLVTTTVLIRVAASHHRLAADRIIVEVRFELLSLAMPFSRHGSGGHNH
jgi:hypothetical protein